MKVSSYIKATGEKVDAAMTRAMKESSLVMLSCVQKNIERGAEPGNAPLTRAVKQGGATLRDTGALRGSLAAASDKKSATVGTKRPYAKTVHDGAEIRAKGKWLCLPASPYTRTLYRRYGWSAREVIDGLRSAGGDVYVPYKRGTRERAHVIMAKEGRKAPRAIFILKKSVKIPPRPFMFLTDGAMQTIKRVVSETLTEVLTK